VNESIKEGKLKDDKKYFLKYKIEKFQKKLKERVSKLFFGKKFKVMRYLESIKSILNNSIEISGGIIEEEFVKDLDYLIIKCIDIKEEVEIKKLTNENLKIVSGFYMDQCFNDLKIVDIEENLIYKPLRNKEIKEMEGLLIAITGYKNNERSDLIYLIQGVGSIYTGVLDSKTNILICKTKEGDKYEFGKKNNIIIVSKGIKYINFRMDNRLCQKKSKS
jgi:NAD-dependent DNA ligase